MKQTQVEGEVDYGHKTNERTEKLLEEFFFFFWSCNEKKVIFKCNQFEIRKKLDFTQTSHTGNQKVLIHKL